MKVFISWSGDSKATAHAIYKALPTLFDTADPWISVENRSGSMWLAQIDTELSSTDFGIVCVTKANQHAPWLNFEAGALSRRVDAKRELMPVLLIGIDSMNEVEGPITGFQMKIADLEGFLDVMKDLNNSELGPKINDNILRRRVQDAWPSIEAEVKKVREGDNSQAADRRTDSEKIDELLDVARSMARSITPKIAISGEPAPFVTSEIKRTIAKEIGDLAEQFGLGEVVTLYPDDKRIVVRAENPVTSDADAAIKSMVFMETSHEAEISYQSMPAPEVIHNRNLRQERAKYE